MSHYSYIVIGNGLIGSAAGRYLSESSNSVAVIGPSEPANHADHDGVFSSHYDQGRLVRPVSMDPIWSVISQHAIPKYADLEARSGVNFHGPVGRIHTRRTSPEERQNLLDWLEEAQQEHGIDYQYFEAGNQGWKKLFPFLDFPLDFDLLYEPGPAGYANPRQMLHAQNVIAKQNGANLIDDRVVSVNAAADGVTIETAKSGSFTADKVLVACGAFTNFNQLLPQPIPLRFKTESMVWGDVSPETAERLKGMPGVGYDIEGSEIDDIYMAPPLLYPDGNYKIKLGCNTANESWPANLETMQTWFKEGKSDLDQPPMESALRGMLPEVDFLDVTSHRCIVTYTPSGYPTIDGAPGDTHGRLFVATGGNGTGAQGSDTLGMLAAGLMLDGRWLAELPREPFLATNSWGGDHNPRTKAQARAAGVGEE